jgi:TonB-linked SusC/RagA family outer membrane protein
MTFAQSKISGKVTSADDGTGIPGVTVQIKGSSKGTQTGLDGGYTIEAESNQTLVYSFVGMLSQEILVGNRSQINVALLANTKVLNELVVTSLGVAKENRSLGYAAQQLGGDDIKASNNTNFLNSITAKSAGVQVTSSAGTAGGSSRIVIRGQSTLDGNNQALIVLDGMAIDNSTYQTEGSTGGVAQSNRAIDINPNDIESITVLKGAAASAIYGVNGARGVLLITTKKGSKGSEKLSFEYSGTYTSTSVNKLPELQSMYAQGTGGVYRSPSTGTSTSFGPKIADLVFDGKPTVYDQNGTLVLKSANPTGKAGIAYDPYNQVFQNSGSWNNSMAMNVNSGNTSYRLSLGNVSENGIVPNNTFDKTNIGLSLNSNLLNNKLHIKSYTNYIVSKSTQIQQGSNVGGLMLGLLRTPATFDNTNGSSDAVNDPSAYYNPTGAQRNYRGGGGYDNPFWTMNMTPYNNNLTRFLGNIDITYDLTKSLKLNAKVGTDSYVDFRTQKYEINSRSNPLGGITEDNYSFNSLDAYLMLIGHNPISSDFSFDWTLGGNAYNRSLNNVYTTGAGLGFPGFVSLANSSSITAGKGNSDWKTISAFATADFGFKEFIFLGLTGRQDYLSNLIAPSKPYKASDIGFFYPSASLSFVFSEFLKNHKAISFGKLRAAYGSVGGGAPSPYLTSSYFGSAVIGDGWTNGVTYPYGGRSGLLTANTLGNPNLIPSRTNEIELGLEMSFFDRRVSFDASVYTRVNKNQIVPVPVASSTGYTNLVLNSGQLSSKGADLVLTLEPVRSQNFKWSIISNFTTWRTNIDKLADGVENQFLGGFSSAGIYNVVGYQYGQIFGGAWKRANSVDGKSFDASLPYNSKGAILIDASGNPIPDETARPIGNPNPKFLLGITNSFTYKKINMSFLFDFKAGGQMWNGTAGALNQFGTSKISENRGTSIVYPGISAADGSVNTKSIILDQSWYQGLGSGFGPVAEQFIQKTNWTRLRSLNVSYDLSSLLKVKGIKGANIGFVGRNLWLKTPYTGIDPETNLTGNGNAQGIDYFNQPGTKSYAINLNLKF